MSIFVLTHNSDFYHSHVLEKYVLLVITSPGLNSQLALEFATENCQTQNIVPAYLSQFHIAQV